MDDAKPYDSREDTVAHIKRVQELLDEMIDLLEHRAQVHDASKLGPVEKPHFDRETPLLKTLVYGSEEYKASLGRLKDALTHHYAHNSHHPEYYPNGVNGMDLLDVVEMVADWKAASERGANPVLNLDVSFKRFGIEPQLAEIITNTVRRRGWMFGK